MYVYWCHAYVVYDVRKIVFSPSWIKPKRIAPRYDITLGIKMLMKLSDKTFITITYKTKPKNIFWKNKQLHKYNTNYMNITQNLYQYENWKQQFKFNDVICMFAARVFCSVLFCLHVLFCILHFGLLMYRQKR